MIIFDLDGTLADCEHRRHFVDVSKAIQKGVAYEDTYCNIGGVQSNGYFLNDDPERRWKPDWQAFYEACDQDEPIKPVIGLLEAYIEGLCKDTIYPEHEIQIWSGRCESVKEKTLDWLYSNVSSMEYFEDSNFLKMRPIGDSTPDDELKEKWLDETIANGQKIEMVFDDRPKVIRMWQRRGIFVFNCCQHNNEF